MSGSAAERTYSQSASTEDFLWTLDVLCRDLGYDAFQPPAARRPKALGRPASELVAELRRGRFDDIS